MKKVAVIGIGHVGSTVAYTLIARQLCDTLVLFDKNEKLVEAEKNDLTEKQNKHATEIAMNDYSNYDYVINNNDTLENLEKEVIKCIK